MRRFPPDDTPPDDASDALVRCGFRLFRLRPALPGDVAARLPGTTGGGGKLVGAASVIWTSENAEYADTALLGFLDRRRDLAWGCDSSMELPGCVCA